MREVEYKYFTLLKLLLLSVTMTPNEYNILKDEIVAAKNKMKNGQPLTARDYGRLKVYNTVL
jgi:hypothetical protein